MTVHIIGAGPGAADLLTLRAVRILGSCRVCLYAGSLVPQEVLAHCPPDARLVDTSAMTLDAIVEEIVAAHRDGHDVARLHSGDPAVFSAVAEQVRRLKDLAIPYDICPGVPAYAAAAASLGRELTVPGVGQTVILTRIARSATAMPPGEELAELGRTGATLVLHLAVRHIEEVAAELASIHGPDCPVAVVAFASLPGEVVLRGTLSDIADQVQRAGIVRTAVIVVGRVLAATAFPDSHLYSCARQELLRAQEVADS
jgi:precorrin-4/cobalt-precorrin-4 C11-methyltransferase